MIPKEIIEKWEKEANESWCNLDNNMHSERQAEFVDAYIVGRTDQYNEQVKEIERLKEIIEDLHYDLEESKGFKDKTIRVFWKSFKQQHNL